jgi:hypothetical protein
MMVETKSPKITHIEWGRTQVEGHAGTYKDVKLYPGGSREWNWNETGTHHTPGIQPQDVHELLEHGAEEIVLSKGYTQRLQVKDETLKLLQEKGIPVHILGTDEAVQLYNQLAEEKSVGALIHSTC